MKHSYLILLFLLAFAFNKAAAQENWVLLDKGKKFTIYYDSLSVSSQHTSSVGNVLLNVKLVYNTPVYLKDIKKTAEYIVMDVELNCNEKSAASFRSILHFTDGTYEASNEKQEWKANGSTYMLNVFKKVCK